MNRFGKRSAALVLAACMLLGLLAGCGKKEGDSQQLSATVYVPTFMDIGNLGVDYVNGGCADENTIYLAGQTELQIPRTDENGESYTFYDTKYDLYRVPLDGGEAGRMPNYEAPTVPEGMEGSVYIENISAVGDGTIWVTETVNVWGYANEKYPDMPFAEAASSYYTPASTGGAVVAVDDVAVDAEAPVEDGEYFEPQSTTVRRHLDSEGGELSRLDVSNLQETLADQLGEDNWINGTSFDREGNLYVTTNTKLFVLDSQMNTLFTLEGEDMWGDLVQLGDGSMGMRGWFYDEEKETGGYNLKIIDFQTQDWGQELIMPPSAYNVYPGGGDYLFYYQVNDAVFGWKAGENAEGGEGEKLFSWIEADIDSGNVSFFSFLPDGRVAAVTREWENSGEESGKERVKLEVVLMTATPRSQLPEKTALIYATMSLDYDARRRIIDFNKKSETYRIEVRDYSEYNTNEDNSAGLQKLSTEIVSGNVPDILDTSGLPMRQYSARGLFEDLWPYIESDPELGREGVMERPLMANEMDGKLYEVFRFFDIRTAVGAQSVVGDRMSWTLAQLQEALGQMPEGCTILGQSDTKENMLSMLMSQNMDNFVDWDSGKCSFDSDNFRSLLEFCNSFPAQFDWENVDWDEWEDDEQRVLNGKQLLVSTYISNFTWDIQRYDALFGGRASFVGFPREDGACGSSFTISNGLAMSTTCKNKEGAWSYIRQLLLPAEEDEYYGGWFPVNKVDFEKMVDEAMNPQPILDENGEIYLDEDGQPIYENFGSIWISEEVQLDMHPATQEDVDRIMALYNAVDVVTRSDENIYKIVSEVAGSYFAGDKPLDNAVSEIQNRVNLYVGESK